MRTLKEREGENIYLYLQVDPKRLQLVRLHLVEDAGIWIESEAMASEFQSTLERMSAPRLALFFIPWGQIARIVDLIGFITDRI